MARFGSSEVRSSSGALGATTIIAGWAPLLLVAAIATQLLFSLDLASLGGLFTSSWDPAAGKLGIGGFVLGTVFTAGFAIVLATPISVLAALLLAEIAPPPVARVGVVLLDLSAAVPSVVYGLCARTDLVPLVRGAARLVGSEDGHGYSAITASLVLTVMCVPTITAISYSVLRALPPALREGPMALGATRWETIRAVLLPCARWGILGAVLLGFGRALGETIAVAMVVGGRSNTSLDPFAPAATLSSVLVDEGVDATHADHRGALSAVALVLLVAGALVSVASRSAIRRIALRSGGAGRRLA